MRILIVEDEAIIAKDLADIVRANGFEAISANFFEEAIQAIQTFKPHIIFCDIDLGGAIDWDGVALVQMVQKELPLVVVVYISALINETIIKKAQKTKPYTYLVKPFTDKQVSVTASMIRDMLHTQAPQISNITLLTEAEFI